MGTPDGVGAAFARPDPAPGSSQSGAHVAPAGETWRPDPTDAGAEAPPEDGNFDGLCPPPNARTPTSERLVRGSNSTLVQDHSRATGGLARRSVTPSRNPSHGRGAEGPHAPAHHPSSGPSLLDIIYIIGGFTLPTRHGSPSINPCMNITPKRGTLYQVNHCWLISGG
jgi:hypothetical protein